MAQKSPFDIVFEGFNFVSGILTLAIQDMGLKVGIVMERKLDNTYDPELSNFYPQSISSAPSAIKDYQFLLKCTTLFPHLFFPKRVLTFSNSGKTNAAFYLSIDKFLQRDRESSTLLINTTKYPEYKTLTYPAGALLFEYSFDRNQAIIELLKQAMKNGAKLIDNRDLETNTPLVKPEPFRSNHLALQTKKPNFQNSIRVHHSNFDFTLIQNVQKQSIQIDNVKDTANMASSIFNICANLGINHSNIESFTPEQLTSDLKSNSSVVLADSKLNDVRKQLGSAQKYLSKILGQKINIDTVFEKIQSHGMTGENFRSIQNECDEKFDLAKQTGIDYSKFTFYFYRYRYAIDAMIDDAYAMMNEERDPNKIWDAVISDYTSQEQNFS